MSEKIFTRPPEEVYSKRFLVSGNEFLSLPDIDPETGGLSSINLLHAGSRGILEFSGYKESLIKPRLQINEEEEYLQGKLSWSLSSYWLPHFTVDNHRYRLTGRIICPPDCKGFFYALQLTNHEPRPLGFRLGFTGSWEEFNYLVFSRRRMPGNHQVTRGRWSQGLLLEAAAGLPLAALALTTVPAGNWYCRPCQEEDRICLYENMQAVELKHGENFQVILYVALNLERDGAETTAVHLLRCGWENLEHQASRWLQEHQLQLREKKLEECLNRNLFFNYFFAHGRALDSGERLALTSRSPRYYVSAAFWSRDALLWSFPALLLVDKAAARDILQRTWEKHSLQAGEHAHYLNGTVLYPGFELDELAAFFIALELYLTRAGDQSFLEEKSVKDNLPQLVNKIMKHYHAPSGLYETFLDPSDDPVTYPFLIYNNALVYRVFSFLAGLAAQQRFSFLPRLDYQHLADNLKQAIRKHGVIQGPYGLMYAWAVDGQGKFELYDNPPGSLQLLPYHGFCSPRDPVYLNTVRWIRSEANPYFWCKSSIREAGSRHAPKPWVLAAANDLLAQNKNALNFLLQASLDNGLACETIDPENGKALTGLAFASGAGFLAYALWYRYGT